MDSDIVSYEQLSEYGVCPECGIAMYSSWVCLLCNGCIYCCECV